jgi:ribosomal protein S18 acetylase RimI-like enzyme
MTQAVQYRAMQRGEEDGVSSLVRRVFHKHVAPLFSDQGVREFRRYVTPGAIRHRSDSSHLVLLATVAGRMVGVIELRDYEHVSLLFVDTALQRQGIARELLSEALAICFRHKPHLREVDVNSSPNAVSAYQRLGFRRQGPEQVKNGIRFVPMVLDLS